MNEVFLAVLLFVSAAMVVTGVALLSAPLAFVSGGGLLAGWAWLTFGDVR